MWEKKTPEGDIQPGKGIDIGTTFINCAERRGDSIVFRSERDAFFAIDYSDFTKEMLTRSGTKYIQKQDQLYVVGDEALKLANVFNKEVRRPMSRGVISPDEKEALPMVELLIKIVVGEPNQAGEIVYHSLPGDPLDADFNLVYHKGVLQGFLQGLGYTPKSITEGLAVVFSELAEEGFTGLGISFGGGMVNVCLSYMSVPVLSFSLSKAGDWIDRQVAMAVGNTATRVCTIKESGLNLAKDSQDKIERALSIYYDYLIEYVIENVKMEFEKARQMPGLDQPITVALAGGTALPTGFAERFERVLRRTGFPLPVKAIKLASQPLRSVVKGALAAALADEGER